MVKNTWFKWLVSLLFLIGFSVSAISQTSKIDKENLANLLQETESVIYTDASKLDSLIYVCSKEAERLNDSSSLCMVHFIRGIKNAMNNDFGPALQSFQKAYALAIEINDTNLQVNALTNMAGVHRYAGQFEKASQKLEKALDLVHTQDRINTRATTHLALGIVYELDGKLDIAQTHLYKALTIFSAEGNVSLLLSCIEQLGGILEHQEDYNGALKLYEFALRGRENSDESIFLISVHQRIGAVNYYMKHYDQALAHLQRSVHISDSVGNYLSMDSSLVLLINTTANLGMMDLTSEYTRRLVQYHKIQEAKNVEESMAALETQYLLSEQALENRLLKAETEQAKLQLSRSQTLLYSSIIILILMAALVIFAVQFARRLKIHSEQLLQFNQQLEEKVAEKTEDLKNRNDRLRSLSWKLAHELRSSVATIVGAKALLDLDGEPQGIDLELYEAIGYSTNHMDVTIVRMIREMEADDEVVRLREERKAQALLEAQG